MRRDGRDRREALLDAALRCFSRRGVLATGIEEIRQEAGASPSSVYHQFRGLPDLTLALLLRTFERLFTHLAGRVRTGRTAQRAVKGLVAAHVEWILEHPEEGRFMYQAMSLEMAADGRSVLEKRKAELLQPIVERFAPFIVEGALPKWSPLQLDVVLLGAAHEACRRYLAGAPIDPAWMRTTLPKLAWRSISDL